MKATLAKERQPLLDVLRGFALIGIFLANLVSFFGYYNLNFAQVQDLPLFEKAVLFLIDWLVEGKFYALFSLLFGVGFAIQLQRAQQSGLSFLPFWYRRMGALLAFGLIHMYFIWYGDILTLYALLGLVLPVFICWSSRRITLTVLVLLLMPLAIHAVVVATADAAFWNSSARFVAGLKAAWGLEGRSNLSLVLSEDTSEVWLANVLGALQRPMSYLRSGRIPQVLGFFLLGILFAREVVPLWREGRNISRRWWLGSLLLGLVCNGAYAWIKAVTATPFGSDLTGLLQGLVYHLGCITLMFGYAGGIAWLWQRHSFRSLLSPLAMLGRMPLTSYITQTTFGVLVFYGYGLGLLGKLPFTYIPLLVALVLWLQWVFASYWLHQHPQGPLEALWRKLSYSGSPSA